VDILEEAILFAHKAHLLQKRKHSGIPYVMHPIEVMKRLSDYGVREDDHLVAALLHDVHEDSPEFSDEVLEKFGPNVYKIMIECSRPVHIDEKYQFLCSFYDKSPESIMIKIADRYCNVQDYINSGKEEYASKYALQAYPIYDAFIKEVKKHSILFESEKITKNVLIDIVMLRNSARKEYPLADDLSIREIRKIVT
jgi:(p)ppGpp synthase/HD superfamily hydrolase